MATTDSNERKASDGFFQTQYRETTLSSIIFGLLFGIVMNAAITYAGLKIGFTVVGSAIAAVVGFGFLRGILRKGSILEVNIAQTVASSVNAATPGIIFTVPVLYLLSRDNAAYTMTDDRFWLVTLAGVVGAVLGVAFIIPLRKQMIDIDRLRFPSGTAVAAILKSPGAGPVKSLVLLLGVGVAVLVYLPVELPNLDASLPGYASLDWRLSSPPANENESLPRRIDRNGDGQPDLILTNSSIDAGRLFGLPDYVFFVIAITPLSFGAGYLTGRAGLMVLAGGILAFFVLNPVAYNMHWMPTTLLPDQAPEFGRANFNRPLGIGMLVGGALMGVIAAFPAIRAALGSIAGAGSSKRSRDELGLSTVFVVVVFGTIALYFVNYLSVSQDTTATGLLAGVDPHIRSLIIALIGAAWIWFSGIIIAQCTGMTDWSPVSGLALLTVVLVMLLAGTGEVVAAVMIGAALCVAIAAAADMMADLKTGYLVGAQPRRQQVLELVATIIGPLISMLTLYIIVSSNLTKVGIPLGDGTATTAPQAQALQRVIESFQGGQLPFVLYITGAIMGVILGIGAFPGLGVLVGLSMYLPLEYILAYGLGCVANMLVGWIKGRKWAEEWGVPFCAGLIVGEAILAMVINLIIIVKG